MILTAASSPRTQRIDAETSAKLRDAARVEKYQECGWHCATGFDAQGRITVMVHANSDREIEIARGNSTNREIYGKY